MGLYDSYRTASSLETEGVWLDLGHTRVRVARAGGANQKYNAAMERVSKQHGRAIAANMMENERAAAIIREVYADHVILAWESNLAAKDAEPEWKPGIDNPDGGDLLPVTKENIVKTLKALPDFFAEIQATATNLQFYKQELLDEAAKN